LHAELAAEHNGTQKWGYRTLSCGSIEAVVSKNRLAQLNDLKETGKTWEKLPKQDNAAKELLETGNLPPTLDWVDRGSVTEWAEMGAPGKTETAQVHPYHFTTSIGELAVAGGVQLRTKAKVTQLNTSKSGVQSVEYLDRETNETKTIDSVTDIIVAAGPWTGRVLPRAKIESLRAHSVVYEADVSPFAVFTDIELPSDFIPAHRAAMGQKRRHKGRVDPEIYARPFGEVYACGKLHIFRFPMHRATPANFAIGEPDTLIALPETADEVQFDEAQCDDIIAYLSTISPVLASAPIKAKQACYLPQHIRFGKESGPLIGATSVPGLWVAAGHTCWGIQNGPATGRLMSEFIFDGAAKSANVDSLDPRKFKV
jgi:glycine/D-amino acid oxidase-like deaminating enzyme